MFSVYDSKVGAYLPPMFMRSRGEAIRSFETAVKSEDHNFNKYASDYTLFELGSWDDETAKFDILATPLSLGVAVEFLQPEKCEISGVELNSK